ncbi:DUF1232 domain-containing protein [Myxococcus sp. K15C18031901]|uniref:YkvA family protein n=1 Tax=Myxococcus dinghuensis TaxID=2906761 RepID=UPI0020A6F41B|nr:DUF1232 domain-containing protein [Myxococcus dinghuensis]MCP3102169.1 DUF1232 domain-containing protein [Myxococcus dinghuensis]
MNIAGLRGMGTRFFRYVRDPRVSLWRKLAGVMAVVYFLSPVDAVPDFIPVLGWLDDLGVLSAAAIFMVREVQRYRPEQPWDGVPRDDEGRERMPPPVREQV